MSFSESFGFTDAGEPIERIRLKNHKMTAHILTYGATLQDLRVEGHSHSVVLGFPDIETYQSCTGYFGAIVGRCANRIRNGRFLIDGQSYQVDQNFLGRHILHGGRLGTDRSVWTVTDLSAEKVTLTLEIADGHMGFPGNMTVNATYEISPDGALDLRISARTDAPTLCNFAAHNYFNLEGGPTTINDHQLRVNAPHYLPVNEELIPTGEIRPVDKTVFDFRREKRIGRFEYDHNFCVTPQNNGLNELCSLSDSTGSLQMTIQSSETGLQVYTGAHINGCCLNNRQPGQLPDYAGVALEPQIWPDAINHRDFPNTVLRPGEQYLSRSRFSFSSNP